MPTKRRTEQDSPRHPRRSDGAVQASPPEKQASEGSRAHGEAAPKAAAPEQAPAPQEAPTPQPEAAAPQQEAAAAQQEAAAAQQEAAAAQQQPTPQQAPTPQREAAAPQPEPTLQQAPAPQPEAAAPQQEPAPEREAAATQQEPTLQQAPAPQQEPAQPSEADRRIEELATQLEQANASRVRIAADFDNYKKRARQEQLDTMRYAAATVAERLLPVVDDADLALSHAPDGVDESWLKGVKLTFQKLEEVLSSVGVERIEAVGLVFDPKHHEAVGSEETAEHPEDTVVAELRAGYRMHDRVLRPALVKVARPPA